jgi:regulation of enolase protein 1 (concanavalin A-like superfamily)
MTPPVRSDLYATLIAASSLACPLFLLLASALSAAEPGRPDPDRTAVILFDGFDKKLRLNWHPIRHDPQAVSLTSHAGHLTITTQSGTIHRRYGATARNIFVIDNPLASDGDFAISTRIVAFHPSAAYHQCGLICYDDDDNYLKWTWEFDWPNGTGSVLGALREVDAESEIEHFPVPDMSRGLWLRISRRGNSYDCESSIDGKTFTRHGRYDWESKNGPKKLGILAKNGGPEDTPSIEAVFDFFEFRSRP